MNTVDRYFIERKYHDPEQLPTKEQIETAEKQLKIDN